MTLADLPAVEDLLLKMKGRTEFVTVKVEFERGRKAMRQCVSSPQGFAAVAVHGDKITGCLLATITHWWFSGERFATDLAFHSQRGDGERLLRMLKGWADSKNVTVQMAVSSGGPRSSARKFERLKGLYAKIGLVPIGYLFLGEKPIAVQAMRSVR